MASTKAFYAQIAAGFLLAWSIAEEVGRHRRPVALVAGAARPARPHGGRRSPGAPTSPPAAQQLAPGQALLGDRRQRHQPHRRRGAAHQAQRALLQVDRLRRHRGQEAHRPVVRAAHPRVRRRPRWAPPPTTWPRRWRSTGPTRRRRSSSPPTAQARFAAALHVIAVPADAPAARLRAHRRWPATSSATRRRSPSTRRPGRCARPAPRSRTRSASTRHRRRGPAPLAARPRSTASSSRFFDGLRTGAYDGNLEASTAVRLASLATATPSASPRSTPTRPSTAGSARRPSWSTTSPPRSPRASRSSTRPVDAIKHQAKTVTVGISRSDETLLAAAARAGGAGRRRPARPPQLQDAAHARRHRPRRRGDHRLDPLRASTAIPTTARCRPPSSTAAASPSTSRRAPSDPACCGARSTRVARRAAGVRHPGPRRRPHARDRARDEGRSRPPASRSSTCASTTTSPVPRAARRAAGLPQPLVGAPGRRARDRAHLPRGPARRRCRRPTCSSSPSASWPTAGGLTYRVGACGRPAADRAPPAAPIRAGGGVPTPADGARRSLRMPAATPRRPTR